MGTHLGHQNSSRHPLPANLLLSSREYKQYRRWQGLFTSTQPSDEGRVNTALQYSDFRLWLAKQDSGYFSDVFEDIADHLPPSRSIATPAQNVPLAPICRHVMHPVVCATRWTRCPCCTIQVHLDFMMTVSRSLQSAAGRPLPGTGTPSEQQEILFRAWIQAKLEALRQLAELEVLAAKEEEWSERNEAIHCDGIKTAKEALQKYWAEITGHGPRQQQIHKKMPRVEFAADTKYEPGRSQHYFWRRSPRYETGKYTLTDEHDEEDQDISVDSDDHTGPSLLVVGYVPELDLVASEKSNVDAGADIDDTDWTDVESDYGDDSPDSSYICFEIQEETEYITFSDE